MKKTLVFVYGSLKKGYSNHIVLDDSTFVGDHVTEEVFTMYDMGVFPCIADGGNTAIHGEVYAVTDEILANLDILEGVPRFYKRKMITSNYGEIVVYVINKECLENKDYPIVKNGVWDNPWELEEEYERDEADVEAFSEYGAGFDDYNEEDNYY